VPSNHLRFEEPQDVHKVLGRTHLFDKGELQYDMHEFAEVICKLYEEERGSFRGFKKARTPYLDESAVPLEHWNSKGKLCNSAAKLIMKAYWLARLSRPICSMLSKNSARE
jgi:hypothetical protein